MLYRYQLGDVIHTDDNRFGIIFAQTNASEYVAIEKSVKKHLIEMYSNILIYKVLVDGTISYIHESNIKGVVCGKKNT